MGQSASALQLLRSGLPEDQLLSRLENNVVDLGAKDEEERGALHWSAASGSSAIFQIRLFEIRSIYLWAHVLSLRIQGTPSWRPRFSSEVWTRIFEISTATLPFIQRPLSTR